MDHHNDFTVSGQNFSGLKEFVEDLHSKHRKYGIILDPGMPSDYTRDEYPAFFEAKEQAILLTHPESKSNRISGFHKSENSKLLDIKLGQIEQEN